VRNRKPAGSPYNDPVVTAIETSGLTKRFEASTGLRRWLGGSGARRAVTAVDRVDLQVPAGVVFALLGPNGAGKTTLIKLLCGLLIPTAGEGRVAGHGLDDGPALRGAVGLATGDERGFFWKLSPRHNLSFFASLHGLDGAEGRTRVDEVLQQLELGEHADEPFQNLSTGLRQRVALARAVLHRPRVLMLDEPAQALDPEARRRLYRTIREDWVGRDGATVLLCTHQLAQLGPLCDRAGFLVDGALRAVEELGPTADADTLEQLYAHHTGDGADGGGR